MGCNSQESTLNYRKYSQSYRAYSNQKILLLVPSIAKEMRKAKAVILTKWFVIAKRVR